MKQVFLLEPIDTNNNNWRASTCRETIVVLADSESLARMLADTNFGIAVAVNPGDATTTMPWGQSSLVKCSKISDLNIDMQDSIFIKFKHQVL